MKRKTFTESQIVAAIQKQESGIPTKEVCRKLGISENTERPHKSLGYLSPLVYASRWKQEQQLYLQTEILYKLKRAV